MKKIRCAQVFALILIAMFSASAHGQGKTIAVIITAGHFKNRDVPSFMPNGKQVDADYIKAGITGYFQRLPENLAQLKRTKKRWQFDRIIELTTELDTPSNRLASRENIINALEEVRRAANAGDAVIFYFSGHGGRRGANFSLCPFDATQESDQGDIQDKELAVWVGGLRTDNVTLILDCCFNEYPASKGIQPQRRPKFLARNLEANVANLQSVFPPDKAVVLTASRQDEEAQEYQAGGSGWVGLYTDQLVRDMQASSPDTTYQSLETRTRNDLQRYIMVRFENSFSQTPDIMGSERQRNRRLFRAAAGAQAPQPPGQIAPELIPPHLDVTRLPNGQAGLSAGSDQEVTAGSEYSVFPAARTDFKKPKGKICVVEVQKDRAIAKVTEGSGVRDGDLAVETKHKEREGRSDAFKILIEAPTTVKADIERAMRGVRQVEMVQNRPALVLKVEGQQGDLLGKLYRTDGDNAFGDPIQEVKAASASGLAEAVRPKIADLTFMRRLVSLNNPNPEINLRIGSEQTVYHYNDQFILTLEALDREGRHIDCFVTLIDIDANGTPTIIFPKKDSDDPKLRNNHLTKEDVASITLHVSKPAGQETLIALATRRRIDSLEALPTLQAASNGGAISKSAEAVSADIQGKPLSEWAKAVFTFVILDPSDSSGLPGARPRAKIQSGRR